MSLPRLSSSPAPEASAPRVATTLQAGSRMHQALAVRLTRVAARLTEHLSEEDVAQALSAATDMDALAVALVRSPLAHEPVDPDAAAAYARGRAAREQLLQAEGGMATSEEMGQLLGGISRQAIDKRRRAGRLVAVRERSDWLYPRWQVAHGQLLEGLEAVLDELGDRGHDPWAMLIFFLQSDTEQEGESPLGALRAGKVEAAICAAHAYGEQGAR